MSNNFNTPGIIEFGKDALDSLPAHVKNHGGSKVFIVTDEFFSKSDFTKKVIADLKSNGFASTVYADVQPDPTDQNVRDGLKSFKESNCNIIVALGGGSVIDAAKVIALMSANPEPMNQYMGYHKFKKQGIPLIAIPTTAGTGSEATRVAVITDTERRVKMMMLDNHLLPKVAIIDHQLTHSMPAMLTAAVGVDTLTHAIEAYVSKKANVMTDPIAQSCIQLVAKHLMTAWEKPGNQEAREGMSIAACQGGMAFSNSSVALVHGMSRPIGAIFHVPHGLSNAMLLPVVTKFSLQGAPERYARISRWMGYATNEDTDATANEKLIEGLESMNSLLKIPSIKNYKGVDEKVFENNLEKMANDALASGSPQNNPVVPTVEDIVKLYREAW